jgi:hypothetical protein
MGEADGVEAGLRDRAGDQRRGRAGTGEPYGELERVERVASADQVETAWRNGGVGDADQRQRIFIDGTGLGGILDDLDRAFPDGVERAGVADREERRERPIAASLPALGDDFGADPRRIAKRNGERRQLSDSRPPRRGEGRAGSAGRAG